MTTATPTRTQRKAVLLTPAEEAQVDRMTRDGQRGFGDLVRSSLRLGGYAMTPPEQLGLYLRFKLKHDSEAEALLRAVAETGTNDTPSYMPQLTAGDITKFVDASRPLVVASNGGIGPRPMVAHGKQFSAARATQLTQAGGQVEKAQLTSRQLVTEGDLVGKAMHGGVIRLTEQDIDWSDPALLDEVYEDLADQYAIDTEGTAAAATEAAVTTNTTVCSSFTDPAVLIPAVVDGITSVRASTAVSGPGRQADLLLVAGNRWDDLAGMVGTDGLPVFPRLATEGPAGLRVLYSPAFAPDFIAVGSSRFVRTWEKVNGLVDQAVPSSLEVQIAYAGTFAALAYAQGLCGLVGA